MLPVMFQCEHIAIKLRNPLPPLHRQFEVTYCSADVRLYLTQKEQRILFGDICGTSKAQLLTNSGLGELIEKRIDLARVQRVSKLSDQIGCSQQASLGLGFRVISVIRHGEASQLDRSDNPLAVNHRVWGHREVFGDNRQWNVCV
jgi:hypothetical protein